MWFVYMIECQDKSLYTGISIDVEKRFKKHKAGHGSKYVRSRKPISIVYQKSFRTKSLALKAEVRMKALTRKEKLAVILSEAKDQAKT